MGLTRGLKGRAWFLPDGGLLKNIQCWPHKVVPQAGGGTTRTSTKRKTSLLSKGKVKQLFRGWDLPMDLQRLQCKNKVSSY